MAEPAEGRQGRPERRRGRDRGSLQGLPRHGRRRRQDLPDARRRAGPRPRTGGTSWSATSSRTAAARPVEQAGGPRVRARAAGSSTATRCSRRWTCPAIIGRAPGARADRRARPHERPGPRAREALRGRRGRARRGHRRLLDRQRPAPREPQRQRLRADRRPGAGDDAGRACSTTPTRSCSWTSPRRRCSTGCATGKIYPAERIDSALNNFFRIENLAALREVALRQVAAGGRVQAPGPGDRRPARGPAGRQRRDPGGRRAAAGADQAHAEGAAAGPASLALGAAARRRARPALGEEARLQADPRGAEAARRDRQARLGARRPPAGRGGRRPGADRQGGRRGEGQHLRPDRHPVAAHRPRPLQALPGQPG